MLIVCPSCASEYTIDPAKLGADGRTVRCAICRDAWRATPGGTADPGPAPAAEPQGAVLLRAAAPAARRRSPGPAALAGTVLALLLAASAALGLVGLEEGAAVREVLTGPGRPAFRHVASEIVGPQGQRTLVVTGEIVNDTRRPVDVSPLEFLVRSGDEQGLVTWTSPPPRPSLRPGEATPFEARLPAPPAEGREVRVQFTKAAGVAFAALTDPR